MKRAEANIIGAPLFKFNKGTHYLYNVYAAKYLLYGILCDQVFVNSFAI